MDGAKRDLRQRMREAVAQVPTGRRGLEEELVNAAVLTTPAWHAAQVVLLYRHKGKEFSVVSLANAAFRDGKRVLFPRAAQEGVLTLHEVPGWHALVPGRYGISEPGPEYPEVGPEEVDLAVVPGLAFDDQGRRLGQGGGYYDRLLPRLGGPAWGVAFEVQRLDAVPSEPHDVPVDRVWSAREAGL